MALSFHEQLVSLPFDIQELISYKVHQLYTSELHENVSLFVDVQEFWKLITRISSLCILDYIEEYIHMIFCPFYTSNTGGFERPNMDSFLRVVESQLKIMTSYEHFEEYYKNELRMLFTEKNNAYVWLGQNLQNNAFDPDDVSKAYTLFSNFSKTRMGSQIPRTMFNKLVITEQESIRRDIFDLYFDPTFEIF